MSERPLCPVCGAYWACGHPHGFLFGIPVFVDERQEELIRVEHCGPADADWTERVKAALNVLNKENEQ